MALLTDYFAASDDEDAGRALQSGPVTTGFAAVESKSLDGVVTMATLEEILTGRDSMSIIHENTDAVVAMAGDGGPWLIRLRPAVVEALSVAGAPKLAAAATGWARTEELAGANPQNLYEFLWNLAHLSNWAIANGRQMYCWMSL
ncbi:MAG TPA: hypothetical protein VI384_00795 [Candidatus Dormibacteraeota bacterium]